MKIAQVVSLSSKLSGVGVVAERYSYELTKLGHNVTLFSPNYFEANALSNYHEVRLWSLIRYRRLYFLPQILWRLWSFDVINLHLPFLGAAIFIYLIKRLRGKKTQLIVNYHWDIMGRGPRKLFYSFYNKHFLPIILKSADKIIVSSLDYIENSNIRDFYLNNTHKFVALPFGVGDNFTPEEKNFSLLKKMNFTDQDSIIGFVGTLDSEHYFKGVNFLITALSRIANPRIKLVIVGDGNLRKQYEHWAKKLGVANRITFTGFVPHELLPEYYNLFDIFVLPSVDRGESFGLVLLEAMACGKPLVASNLKGVREVAVAGKSALLVEPENPKDIADKILYLLEDRELYNHFREGGLQLIAERYRWNGIVKKLVEIYNEH